MAKEGTQDQVSIDTDADRYPTIKDGLRKLLHSPDLENLTVDRLDVRFLANGDVTCRMWEPRADDFLVVFVPEG